MRLRQTGYLFLVILLAMGSLGCASGGWDSSRWAMDNPEYREKYSKPYKGNTLERLPRKIKQMSDARFNKKRGGLILGTMAGAEPVVVGGEIGFSYYHVPWSETHVSLVGLGIESGQGWYSGLKFGQRIQTPTRLSPFAGVGVLLAASSIDVLADNDGKDNDGDFAIDEAGERKEETDGVATLFPELGIQYWITSDSKLTLSSQYHFNSNGRDKDFWVTGATLSFYFDPDPFPEDDE